MRDLDGRNGLERIRQVAIEGEAGHSGSVVVEIVQGPGGISREPVRRGQGGGEKGMA
ncbi:hypothetical protein D3C86_2171610 [compost metagenome]